MKREQVAVSNGTVTRNEGGRTFRERSTFRSSRSRTFQTVPCSCMSLKIQEELWNDFGTILERPYSRSSAPRFLETGAGGWNGKRNAERSQRRQP